jgi:hypothetical protein
MKHDPETYLLAIETFLKANLNTEIANLNTEKNDSITLMTIVSDAYFLQTLNDTVANYNPHILIGLDDIGSSGIGPGTVKTLTFSIIIILEDRGEDLLIGRRMLRYGRVLEDLLNRSFNKIIPHATFKINSLVPIAITSVNSNDPYRAVGAQIVTALG